MAIEFARKAYNRDVTGEIDKRIEVAELIKSIYPQDNEPYNQLGTVTTG